MSFDWWTLGIQAVNVLILVWLLHRFFWRPVSEIIDKRRVAAQDLLDAAKSKRADADAALADIEKVRAGFADEREAVLAEAREAAERLRGARLAEAEAEADALREAVQAEIRRDRAAAEAAMAERVSRLAVEIAARLAARLDGAAVRAAFVDWLIDEIKAMPDGTRQAVAAHGNAIEAVSAAELSPDDQKTIRRRLAEAFGAEPKITFMQDPALIAGFELHGSHFSVGNSWRADLSRILKDLLHET